MDDGCLRFILDSLSDSDIRGHNIIDLGSLDVNGSPRESIMRFSPAKYVGLDIRPGKSVDVVADACDAEMIFGKESFDVAICASLLEHAKDWKSVVHSMKAILKSQGIAIVTVPSIAFPRHDYPNDYWRFTRDDIAYIFKDFNLMRLDTDVSYLSYNHSNITNSGNQVFFCGFKPQDFHEVDLSDYNVYAVP
jgi:SAM-dependent methyltransferase